MRNMEAREKTQNQYIVSLERRFVNLCQDCKKRDSQETAFTSQERYSISRILELLERQEERVALGESSSSKQGVTGTASGLTESASSSTKSL